FGSLQVGLQRVFFLVVTYAFISAVYIYDMKRFCVFKDEISSAGQIDGFTESCLYLFGYSKLIEDRRAIMVIGNNICFIRSYFLYIVFGVVEDAFIIDDNPVEIFSQQITQYAGCFSLFTQDFTWRCG